MTIVVQAIILFISALVVGLLVRVIDKDESRLNQMSFKEAMDLAELPVVTFYQGDEKFNFLLDTGSNHSHISTEAAQRIEGEVVGSGEKLSGLGGDSASLVAIEAKLYYKGVEFEETLQVGAHLDSVFADIKNETGVQVHGIIGNVFLNKNKYVLDFDDLIAYQKK